MSVLDFISLGRPLVLHIVTKYGAEYVVASKRDLRDAGFVLEKTDLAIPASHFLHHRKYFPSIDLRNLFTHQFYTSDPDAEIIIIAPRKSVLVRSDNLAKIRGKLLVLMNDPTYGEFAAITSGEELSYVTKESPFDNTLRVEGYGNLSIQKRDHEYIVTIGDFRERVRKTWTFEKSDREQAIAIFEQLVEDTFGLTLQKMHSIIDGSYVPDALIRVDVEKCWEKTVDACAKIVSFSEHRMTCSEKE